MIIQRIAICLLWLAALITLGHSVVPHHHDHDEVAHLSTGIYDDHKSDLGEVIHHIHGLATGPEESYLPHQSHYYDFSKCFTENDVLFFQFSPSIVNNPIRIFNTDYGEPPPDIFSQFLVSTSSFRGPPAVKA